MTFLYLLIIALTLAGIAVGKLPVFRMNRTSISVIGVTLLLITGAIDLDSAWEAIDSNTIVLLFAMMVLNANMRISGFFNIVTSRIRRYADSPDKLLIYLVFASGILSAFFLNDTIVLVFTPVILSLLKSLNRNPVPYLIALATSANVGSAATIIGNPQNMLIGMASGIDFARFMLLLSPAAFAGLLIIIIVMRLLFRNEFVSEKFEPVRELPFSVYKPLLIKSLIAGLVMIAGLLGGFSIPLSALTSSAILLFTRRLKPERVFKEIDFSLLVFFACLFILTNTLGTLLSPEQFQKSASLINSLGMPGVTFISAVLSNLISNVPAVLLLGEFAGNFSNRELFWSILSMSATFAGNLTIMGSVANLIVAESAKKQNVHLTFYAYLIPGVIISVLTIITGYLLLTLF